MKNIQRIKTISEFHRLRKLSKPAHPLISVVNYADVKLAPEDLGKTWMLDFYFISLKKNMQGKIQYGQLEYDFDEGIMFFISPGQVYKIERAAGDSPDKSGWMLLVHPDFFWNTSLAKNIRRYEYFDYSIHEALFVSPKEEAALWGIVRNIKREYETQTDHFSQNIIISQIETLLNYAERFYNRQFITRKKSAHQMLGKLEGLFTDYFSGDEHMTALPAISYFAERLHVSPKYLSSLLKALTGQTLQQLIHEKLIERAKEKLSATDLSVSEIAYELGFGYPQSFSKLFKTKTSFSPLAFRKSFGGN